jgi:hypothetical protein
VEVGELLDDNSEPKPCAQCAPGGD